MRKALVLLVALAACSGVETGRSDWVGHQTMQVARSEHPAVVVSDEIVVLGGLVETAVGRFGVTASVEAYDPSTDTWRALPDLPEPRHHMMAAAVDDRLFAIGGFSRSGNGEMAVWELVGDEWGERAPLPVPLGAGAAVTLDGGIYVLGGAPVGGLYRYSSDDDAWLELAPPSRAREHVAAVAFEGEIWAVAGRWQGEIFSSTEIYDPITETWQEGPPLAEPRSGFGATVVEGAIVVAGGEVFDPDEALASVERYVSGEWETGESLPFGLHGIPLVQHESRVYVPGGSTRAGDVENPGTMWSLSATR